MRLLSIILMLGLANGTIAQSLKGGFFINDKDSGFKEGYYFWENGEFTWFRLTGAVRELGRGKFSTKNDSLTLDFLMARKQFDTGKDESIGHFGKNCVFRIKAMYSNGIPFEGLKATLVKTNITYETNSEGLIRIELIDPVASDKIHFEKDGYITLDVPVSLSGYENYLEVIVDDKIRYKENSTEKFSLEMKGQNMILNTLNGLMVFKTISKKKYLDFYYGIR